MLFALMVGATSEAQTTLEKSNIIIDGGTRVDETFEYTVDHGSVTVKDIDADTRKVTLTIAPAIGYCIQKSDILVQKLADPAEAAAPRRVPDFTDPLIVSGPVMSKAADFTFVVPDGYAGALVKVSFTELTVATAVVNPNTLVYTGEAQELVTLGSVAGAKFDEGTVLAEHTSLAGYYMKSDNNYSPCSTSDEANGTTKYYKPVVTYKVEGPYDSGTVLEAGASLNDSYYTKTDDGYAACNSNTAADGTTTYYQCLESFSTDEGFAADNRLKTNAGNYVVYYKVASDNNHADGSGSVHVTIHSARLTEVTLEKSAINYTGSELTFEPKQVKAGTIVVSSTGYDVSGDKNTAQGNYLLTVTGKGNYTGTVTANYTITPAGTIIIDGNTTSDDVTNSAGTYILAADVSASVFEKLYVNNNNPVTFTGTLDGNFHTISGLSHALFNTIEGGTVKNVMLDDVVIGSGTNVGAIANEATGSTRIYNCGILPSSVERDSEGNITGFSGSSISGSDNVGGIVGLLDGEARVINCFSYANVSGGTNAAGIVGNNAVATTANSSNTTTYLKTMVMNCMFYGNIKNAATMKPVYGGQVISNAGASGVNNYNYYRNGKDVTFDDNYANFDAYYCTLPADEEYLTRFEYYRSILNSNKKLCTWWINGTSGNSPTDEDVETVGIAKWVLDPEIAPYPILKKWGKYPSVINQDPEYVWNPKTQQKVSRTVADPYQGKQLGTISVTVKAGAKHPGTGTTSLTLPSVVVMDMDTLNHDYGYAKIQLPYYNEVFGDPAVEIPEDPTAADYTTKWNNRYGGNYKDYVVTGWKITSISGGTPGTFKGYATNANGAVSSGAVSPDDTSGNPWEDGFNFADRNCTNKDLYSKSGRVFAQGGYFYVPEGVTAITIEAYWGKAVYLHNSEHSLDRVNVAAKESKDGSGGADNTGPDFGSPFTPAGTLATTFQTYEVKTNLQDAIAALTNNASYTVYDQAIVLVGNVQVKNRGGSLSSGSRPFTIMSCDLDMDNEPDYCLQFQQRNKVNRPLINPVRFDFLPVPELGLAIRTNIFAYAIGLMVPKGHFEITETSFMHTTQFEYDYDSSDRSEAPLILNGGHFEQIVVRKGPKNRNSYILMGGHFRMKRFTPGWHATPQDNNPIRHCAVNAIGGEYPEFYLSGIYAPDKATSEDNPHCYTNGGYFGLMAGAGYEQVRGDVTFKIDHSIIGEFYGGGINAAKPVTGNIDVTINNSLVGKYCGGPKVGVMSTVDGKLKTVTTNATGTTFGTFYGGGNGGTSYYREKQYDNTREFPTTDNAWKTANGNYTPKFNEFNPLNQESGVDAAYKNDWGYHAEYEFEVFNASNGLQTSDDVIRLYYHWAQFGTTTTGDVSNTLTNCTVTGDFFGGGYLANVTGNVTSTLKGNTHIYGSAFAAGYSASIPSFPVHNKSTVRFPKKDKAGNVDEQGSLDYYQDDGKDRLYTWCYKNSTTGKIYPSEVTEIPSDVNKNKPTFQLNNKWYCYTTVSLEDLGMVSGTATINIEDNTTVDGSVYGGGEESVVDGSTTVSVTGGTIGIAGKGGADYGNVYGGGKGKNDNVMAGLVKGNTNVEISGSPTIYHNVYGGGAYGSVGDFVYDSSDKITNINKDNDGKVVSGKCTVTITGGTFGWNGKENGMVFGSSRGDVGAPDGIEDKMAWVYDTEVKIGTSGSGSVFTTPNIRGSVYGGGENGHNLHNSNVYIYSGTIGIPTGEDVVVANSDNTSTTYEAYNYPYRGNVYGGGCGTDTYWIDANSNKKVDEGETHYNPIAGIVRGNATVNITGGHVVHNVYGAGAMGSVGTASDASSGKTTINISGGRIGYDGSRNGNVFGAARGEYGIEQTFANVRETEVNISYTTTATGDNEDKTVQLITGSVFGGGEAGTVKGSVAVNMTGGLILKDIYGGGALADTQTDNWDENKNDNAGGWAEGKSSASSTTFVNLLGGTIAGEAYGGGLGEAGKPAYVYGDTKVNLNGMEISEYKNAYATILQLVDGNNDGDTDDNDEDYYRVNQDVRGCAVHQVFGCNNINGTPMGESKVHVFATQNKNTENIGSRLTFTEPATDKQTYWSELATTYGMNPETIIGDATTDEAKINLLKAAVEASRYDVLAVYGGGNLSAYEPVNALSADETTKASAHTNVIIDGCGLTSIQNVYGGGNAASTPATNVTVNGTYEIEEVFGGGNGKDNLPNGDPNPGANVGFKDYSAEEETYNTKEKRTEGAEGAAFIAKYVYGSGKAAVNIFGGTIHRVFGGSNTKGNVRQTAVTLLDESSGCDFCVDEAYGGGKSAPMDAEAKLHMACIPGLQAAYGGAEAAAIQGNVTLNITNGTFDRVFGGNNLSGTIKGSITVNIEEVGCKPIKIGELYGGGNQAGYSVYGYDSDDKPIEKGDDPLYDDPQVNVKSFTSIGNIYGGGFGTGATMVGNPTVNINEAYGRYYNDDSSEVGDNAETPNHYPIPSHAKGKIGAINNVFGGGNAAKVIGNTAVNIAIIEEVYVVKEVAAGASVIGYYTRSGKGTTADPFVYTALTTGTAVDGTTYYEKKDVMGVDIRGNVYGGGNNAEVTGNTNVVIGKQETTTTTP